MTVLLEILGALLFFALIIVSVCLHEAGHFIPAKIFGIKVTEFFAGFGPRIWSRRRGETEYGLKWIPAGGYVKLVGMFPPQVTRRHPNWLTRLADEAHEAERDDWTPADNGRLFSQKPIWQRLIVMSGGILTNLLLAFLIFWAVFGIYGRTGETTTVATVSECMIPASRSASTCQPGDAETPAHAIGLRAGDRIVSFNGTAIGSWSQLSELIRANRDGAAAVVVERAGSTVRLPATRTVLNQVVNRLDPGSTVEAGFLGFAPATEIIHSGPADTVAQMWTMSKQSLYALVRLPVLTWNVGVDMVTGLPPRGARPIPSGGAPGAAAMGAGYTRLSTGDKLAMGGSLLGSLNLFLFWLNVVPLLPMDGGHIAGALYEACKRVVWRMRGKGDPGPVDTAMMIPVAWAIGAVMVVMGAVLIIADIVSPVKIL
ncbi:M50 family metallopeptidase [Acidipropionibacterium jensenii]|uniref:M50 family metallopeptidase n=1 Tax=Acidipropionibacterium jensenii TaxID=1749 RepID=UPI002649CADA|nr:site-2 protease family protein [Acidipropionibacterium jensenii]MDN6591809.1 site-2 protease family protein [Acidipropionibacterium jensenii]